MDLNRGNDFGLERLLCFEISRHERLRLHRNDFKPIQCYPEKWSAKYASEYIGDGMVRVGNGVCN